MKNLPKLKLRVPNKLVPKTRRSKIICLALILLAVSVMVVGTVLFSKQNKEQAKDKEVAQKIEKMDQNEDLTCREVVDEVGSTPADELGNLEIKKELLERQMACLADQQQLDSALEAAEKLKEIYSSQSDSRNVRRIDNRIEDMKAVIEQDKAETEQSNDSPQQ